MRREVGAIVAAQLALTLAHDDCVFRNKIAILVRLRIWFAVLVPYGAVPIVETRRA
jgi:hypothetical protein